jgi:hypothetical protein
MAVSRAEAGTNTSAARTSRRAVGAALAPAAPSFLDPDLSAGERAAQLGYGDGPEAVLAMQRWHDATHVIACRLLGLPYSPTLHWVASGAPAHSTRHADAVGMEEEVTLALQCFVQTGERTGPLRIFFLLGWEEESITAAVRNAVEAER